MAKAKKGDTVKVHYTGKLDDDKIFDSSLGGEPLEFTIGKGHVIEGFEDAIIGMDVNDTKVVNIPPAKAYGENRKDLIAKFPLQDFPPDFELEVGQKLEIPQEEGQSIIVTVTELSKTEVTLDANHELAGKTLIFDLHLISIG